MGHRLASAAEVLRGRRRLACTAAFVALALIPVATASCGQMAPDVGDEIRGWSLISRASVVSICDAEKQIVVWHDRVDGHWSILATDADNTVTSLSPQTVEAVNPAASGGNVVWLEYPHVNSNRLYEDSTPAAIVLMQIDSRERSVIATSSGAVLGPAIRGKWVAWVNGATDQQVLHLVDAEAGAQRDIPLGPGSWGSLALTDRSVGLVSASKIPRVLTIDVSTGAQLSTFELNGSPWGICASSDTLIWAEGRESGTTIMSLCPEGAEEPSALASNLRGVTSVVAEDDQCWWTEISEGERDFLHVVELDLASSALTVKGDGFVGRVSLAASDDLVVAADSRGVWRLVRE